MQDQWRATAIAAATLPSHPDYQDARIQRQVSTYLLYRSLSMDERNRRGLTWWREAARHHSEGTR